MQILRKQAKRLARADASILALLGRGVSGPFEEKLPELNVLEIDFHNDILVADRPQSIIEAATRVVATWRKLADAGRSAVYSVPAEPETAARESMENLLIGNSESYSSGLHFSKWHDALANLPIASNAGDFSNARQIASSEKKQYFDALISSALAPVRAPDWKSLVSWPHTIDASMEPRLQVAIARHESGSRKIALASTTADEIAVVAEVDDVKLWETLSEVKVGVAITGTFGAHSLSIVTGRIPIERIEYVRTLPFVHSLTAARPVHPTLVETTKDMLITQPSLSTTVNAQGGHGVVIGIVDFGCDFAHKNFLDDQGETRIEALWVQAGTTFQATVPYGRLYTKLDIDTALKATSPYEALDYGTGFGSGVTKPAHGTHVMDIAAGNGRGTGVAGCAPESTIIFVDLSATDVIWHGPDAIGQSLGDSVRLLEAVNFIFERAGDRPCVVNLSLGTNGGPHDGSTLVEQGLDSLIKKKDNRAITVAAGNSQTQGIHQDGILPGGGYIDLLWQTKKSLTGQEMEIWMPRGSLVALEVIAPDGTSLGVTEPGANSSVGTDTQVVLYVANVMDVPYNHDSMIGIFLAGTIDAGKFTIRLSNRDQQETSYHAWIERADTQQSSFVFPTESHTLGSISCGKETICVGSYDAHKKLKPLSYFSSTGPTRDGRYKPDISAPGHAVRAALSGSGNGVVEMSGTSMAAPAVSGLIALMFAEAKGQGKSLAPGTLRAALVQGVNDHSPGNTGAWSAGYGYGRACTLALKQI